MIPYGRQEITSQDIESIVNVLRSDFITQGPVIESFEEKLVQYCGASFALAVNSATSALHMACLALDVGPRDIVWTSPISFVASSNCALYCGASVDFVDIDPITYNLCCQALEEKLKQAKKDHKLPKVVIVVHFTGQSCEMEKINELSKYYGFKIIEDASHAIGGWYKDKPVGACIYSDICVFSFHPVKIITTGEGGAVLTNDNSIFKKLEVLRTHGITKDPNLMFNKNPDPWYYEQNYLGFNYRMTDFQAALGVSQIDRLDKYVSKRNQLAERYDFLLKDLPLTIPFQCKDCYSSRHLYVIRLNLKLVELSRRDVFAYLRENQIGVQVHYIPIPSQPYYRNIGFVDLNFPNSVSYYEEAISLPLFPTMTEIQQDKVVKVLQNCLAL